MSVALGQDGVGNAETLYEIRLFEFYQIGIADMKFEMIEKKVYCALELLRLHDYYLLKEDINERSITHKLAEHLQYCFFDYNVDCEYNRNINEPETSKIIRILKSSLEDRDKNTDEKSVYPDIIVHKRGRTDNNLLIVELKKSTSDDTYEYDYLKLKCYTQQKAPNTLNYQIGVFIKLFTGSKWKTSPELIWFERGLQKL